MTRLIFGLVVSFGGIMLTYPSSAPIYPAQNSLPRFLQGQIFFFTANAFMLGVVFHIVAYMRCGGRKQPSHQNISSELTSESRSSGSWMTEDKGDAARSERVRQDLRKKYSLPSAGAQPFVRIILTTLQGPAKSSRNSSHQSGAQEAERTTPSNENNDGVISSQECCRASGTVVMDMGDGVLRDVDCKTLGNEAAAGVLSKGSHAFVKCYGERHLRCAWHAFDFGFAGGHSLLADSGMVLMSGEIEVDASCRVTRWLMGRCGQAMPPRWAVDQSGLPITSAWAFIAGPEVDALSSPDRNKEALIAEGTLEHLKETAPTTNSSSRLIAPTPNIGVSDTDRSPQGARTSLSTVGTTSDKCDDALVGMSRHGNGPDSDNIDRENTDSVGSSSRSEFATAGTHSTGVAPSRTIHARDIWVMKLGDDFEWQLSVSQSIFAAFREALASCSTFARGCTLKFQCHHPQRPSYRNRRKISPNTGDNRQQQHWWAERGGSSGSDDPNSRIKWGLGDVEVGWETDFDGTEKKAKDTEESRDATRAHLQGGFKAGARGNHSRREKASIKPHRVRLEVVLESTQESTKEDPVIADEGIQEESEEKGDEGGLFDTASHSRSIEGGGGGQLELNQLK
jgi:hypothetical protein